MPEYWNKINIFWRIKEEWKELNDKLFDKNNKKLNDLLEFKPFQNIKLSDLFKKIKFHFINQHPLANFQNFPKDPKIGYIGGIIIEGQNIVNQERTNEGEEEFNGKKYNCVVICSFGTVFGLFGDNELEDKLFTQDMLEVFREKTHCIFKFRKPNINNDLKLKFSNRNIEFIDGFLDQQKYLSKPITKLFISHCGQNSLNEAMYAGIPILCLPSAVDQFYNSSLVEQLEIGIYLNFMRYTYPISLTMSGFKIDFKNAVTNLLKRGNKYLNNTKQLKKNILGRKIKFDDYKKYRSTKDYFLSKVAQMVNVH